MSRIHFDWFLVLPAFLLIIIGILILRSVAPQLFVYQIVFTVVSIAAFLLFSALDHRLLFAFYFPNYVLSIILLLIPFFIGSLTRGTHRWIPLGQFTLQPSEIIKPFLLIAFTQLVVNFNSRHSILKLLLLAGIPLLIIFIQPDLGTTLVVMVGFFTALLFQLRLKYLALIAGIFILFIPIFYRFGLRDYQQNRLETYINPYSDPLDKGYHVIQSTIAVGSGQLLGRGLGRGTQSQLRFLPERYTDFIFASLAEELGLVGASVTLLLYFVIIWRIYHISQGLSDLPANLFCLSSASLLSFQIFVNVGMNMGIAPVTGITLPLLSYGGSSLLSMGILLGIINSISKTLKPRYIIG